MINMDTSVLVPIQSINFTKWTCYIDTLFAGGCGTFTYSVIVTPTLDVGVITINQQDPSVFNISVSPTSNSQIGLYNVRIFGELVSYTARNSQSATFQVNIRSCIVTDIAVTFGSNALTYQIGMSQIINSVTVAQSPACGYATTLSALTTADLSLFSVDGTNSQLQIGVYSDLTLLNTVSTYTIPVTATISDPLNSAGISTGISIFTLYLVDPCLTTTISANSITIVMKSIEPTNSLVFNEFTDTVSVTIGGATPFCGSPQYELQSSTDPYTLFLTTSINKTFQFSSSSLSDVGTYTRSLKVSLQRYPSIVYYQSVTIVVLDPCWQTTLTPPVIADLTTAVLQPSVQKSFTRFEDSVFLSFGADVCGLRNYWLSWTTINNWGGNFDNTNAFFATLNTPTITAGAISQQITGNYTIKVYSTLASYSNISAGPASFTLQILPCRVDSFTMQTPDLTTYVLNYVQSLFQPQTLTFSPVQALACGYNPKVSLQAPLSVLAASFIDVQYPLGHQQIQFTLLSQSRIQVGTYTISLKFELTDYPTDYYSQWLVTQSFVITILDPCSLTTITNQIITNLQVLSAYTTSIQDQLNLTPFVNDLVYQSQMPIKGVYFYDTVSAKIGQFEFCGPKVFSFSGNYPNCISLSGSNGDILTLKATSSCKAGLYNVTLQVALTQNILNKITTDFKAIVILVVPPVLPNQMYVIDNQQNTITISPFGIETGTQEIYTPQDVIYSVYYMKSLSQLKPPLYCPSLYSTGSLLALPSFIKFDQTLLVLSYFTKATADAGDYFLVICEDMIRSNISYVSQFTLSVRQTNGYGAQLQNQLPVIASSQIVVPTCSDSTTTWSYKVPQIQDPNGYTVSTNVDLGSLTTRFVFFAKNNTISSVKPFQDIKGLKKVEVSYQSESGSKSGFTLSLVFSCPDAFITKQQNDTTVDIQNQKQPLLPTIAKINNDGIVKIQFSNPIFATKEELETIRNKTVYIDQKAVPIITLRLSNPNGVSYQVSNFNWSVVSYEGSTLTIRLNFQEPAYVSAYTNKDSLQVQINAFWLFHDVSGNYVRENTVTQIAQIPPQSSADQTTTFVKIAQATTSSFASMMGGNAILQLLLAGSIQQLLSAMRTIQIISHMMLINVATPASAQIFFGSLLNFVTMDLFPSLTALAIEKFEMDEVDGINYNFEQFGYSTKLSFVNYGSSSFLFLVVPVLALTAKLIARFNIKDVSSKAESIYRSVFWNQILGYCYEMYTVIAVCSLMNIYYFRWDTTGNIFNSCFCIFFGLVSLVLPVFYSYFYFKNFQSFLKQDNALMSRYGTLTQELNLKRQGRPALVQPLVSMMRKLLLVCAVVILDKKPLTCVIVVNFSSLAYGIFIGWYQPFKLRSTNRIELVNEFFILSANYHLFCFTDFVTPLGKDAMGVSLIYVTMTNFLISIVTVLIQSGGSVLFKLNLILKREKQASLIRKKRKLEMQNKNRKRQQLIKELKRKAHLKSWQEKKEKQLDVIKEELEGNQSEDIDIQAIKEQRKKLIKQFDKQFALDREAAAAEQIEKQLRLNLPIAARLRPLQGTLRVESEITKDLVEAVTQIPYQLSLLSQFKPGKDQNLGNVSRHDSIQRFESQQKLVESELESTQFRDLINQKDPVDDELILKIPQKFLQIKSQGSRNTDWLRK